MRVLSLIACLIILSASSCEESTESNLSDDPLAINGTCATVTTDYADEGCSVLLEIEEDGQKVLLMPVELDGEFQKHGTKVSIEFHSSKIAQSECQVGRPIIIDEIVLVE